MSKQKKFSHQFVDFEAAKVAPGTFKLVYHFRRSDGNPWGFQSIINVGEDISSIAGTMDGKKLLSEADKLPEKPQQRQS